ncbi:hypothetical protein [uncultured Corynebacterium sp.]|uniref:hypothetical protein n=1 Tax=uncultured Corynebacterium sp. TaxID=159447 RepID=UPI0025928ABF|nr:hypothetical protein [uncultured Corynebacterium sp.]
MTNTETGQTYQYGVTYTGVNNGGNHISWIEPTGDPEEDAEALLLELAHWKRRSGQIKPNRIVRRPVGEIEVVE